MTLINFCAVCHSEMVCCEGLKWGQQNRSITVPFSEARGPTNARHLAATLYRNEDYFFQIDSHTTFRQARCQP